MTSPILLLYGLGSCIDLTYGSYSVHSALVFPLFVYGKLNFILL